MEEGDSVGCLASIPTSSEQTDDHLAIIEISWQLMRSLSLAVIHLRDKIFVSSI